MPPYELTRRAMYDLVWSRPMIKVAEELGVSDVALKKIPREAPRPKPASRVLAKKEPWGDPITNRSQT